jgi:hypothetical protein
MHSVIEHLQARANKTLPFHDDRKIALVLFGGLMVSARGAAALLAVEEMGLGNAFDAIYTMSSGFPNASYFLSGQMKMGAAAYYQDFSGFKFLSPMRPRELADLDHLIRVVKTAKPIDLEKLFASRTKLYSRVTKMPDLNNGIFLEVHDVGREHYFELLRACVSLPFIAGGSVPIGSESYRDVFYDQALKDFMAEILLSDATDLLVVYNYDWQRAYTHDAFPDLDPGRTYELCPPFYAGRKEWVQKMTRFEVRSWVLKRHAQQFGNQVKRAFGSNEPVSLP